MAATACGAAAWVLLPLQQAGKTAGIPPQANWKRPRQEEQEGDKARHLLEHGWARLKPDRAIATRYDKRANIFLAAGYMVAAIIWLIEAPSAHKNTKRTPTL